MPIIVKKVSVDQKALQAQAIFTKETTELKFGRSISWSVTIRARIARLAFLGKDSEICPPYDLVGLKNFV